MADAIVVVPPTPSPAGPNIDNTSITVSGQTVMRQRGNISSPSDPNGHAEVRAATPGATDYGMVTRIAPNGLTAIVIDTAASGLLTLIAGVAGKTVKLWKLYLRANGATTVTVKDSTPANLMGAMDFADGGDLLLPKDPDPWLTTAVGQGLQLNNSNAVQLSGVALVTQS